MSDAVAIEPVEKLLTTRAALQVSPELRTPKGFGFLNARANRPNFFAIGHAPPTTTSLEKAGRYRHKDWGTPTG